MDVITILTLSGLGFTLAAPLGPVNAEMIKKSLSHQNGWIYGFLTGIGAMTGDFIIAMSILFIGAEVFSEYINITWIKVLLLLANIVILGYIGISALHSDIKVETKDVDVNLSITKQYRIGFFLVLTSPWSYAWWASFGPLMLDSGIPLSTTGERLIATIFFLSGIFTWLVIFNILLKISHTFASPRILSLITKGSAILLLGFAAKTAVDLLCVLFIFCPFG